MQNWEYITFTAGYAGGDNLGIVKMYDDAELADWKQKSWTVKDALRDLGGQGWELVTVVWRKTGEMNYADPVYYLKRPKG